ncbi:hypothetical protein DPX16_23733 [Anabarilius grahami]|uniref:Zinc finger BED domain-containing protein 1 n=1 Tax=Anabarilius grahami TaxID=495550 RepID=A0A3N0Y9P9_ANAGA|nr:hypothetical protein DPX16_23733 [Anabarilius grahami]
MINACRDDIYGSEQRAFARQLFDPYKPLGVVFMDLDDKPEGAVDEGAPGHIISACPIRLPRPMVSAIFPSTNKMKPLTTIVKLTAADVSIPVTTLLDSGSARNFILGALCRQLNLNLKTTATPATYQIHSITGKPHCTVKFIEQVTPGDEKQRAGGPRPPKQQKLDFGAKPVSGGELKKLVGQFVVEEMLPLNTVDSRNKIPTTVNAALPHRTAFSSYMEEEYAVMERNLKAALNEVDFVATTADIWTANNRSYMGVTLHWISRSTLERNKAVGEFAADTRMMLLVQRSKTFTLRMDYYTK